MSEGDEMREMWQSQTLNAAPLRAPRFETFEELTVPDYMPLSRMRKASYVFAFGWQIFYLWRHWPAGGWLVTAASCLVVAAALAGIAMLLRGARRGLSTPPEQTLQQFRDALAAEFDRQFATEKRILIMLIGGWVGSAAVSAMASGGWLNTSALVMLAVALAIGSRIYLNTALSARRRFLED